MGNLTQYFELNAYKPQWFIGDRVSGKWNKIPFVGTVGNDRLINHERGPEVTVHLDLPIVYQKGLYQILVVKPSVLKSLVSL